MSEKYSRRFYLLSITGEPCQICRKTEPWTHRIRIEILETGSISKEDILCPKCIQSAAIKLGANIYDALLNRYLSPFDLILD